MISIAYRIVAILSAAVVCAVSALLWLKAIGEPAKAQDTPPPQFVSVPQVQTMPPAPPAPRDPEPPLVGDVLENGVLIVVSKRSQRMSVFKDGQHWRTVHVSTGKKGHATPSGVFPILQKKVFHRSNLYSNAPMPYMQRLTWSGIALHAGPLPGYPASHGCIRLPRDVAKALYGITRFGRTTVVVTNDAMPDHARARGIALAFPRGKDAVGSDPPLALVPTSDDPVDQAATPIDNAADAASETIQLAAATSGNEAEALWARLQRKNPALASFRKSIVPAQVGGRLFYRLRASAPAAHSVCRQLQSAGVACFAVS